MSESDEEVMEIGKVEGEAEAPAADSKDELPAELPAVRPAAEEIELMKSKFAAMKEKWAEDPSGLSVSDRRRYLDTMLHTLLKMKEEFVAACSADFCCRSRAESLLAEMFTSVSCFKYNKSHVKKWAKNEGRSVPWFLFPSKGHIQYQPKGVVGIMAPWNYPVLLCMAPLAAAIAAGCRVLLKPSELTPRVSALIAKFVADVFPEDVVHVHVGGVEVGIEFSKLPFDHLLYTGSTSVGRKVMMAAAENLTPVTLELGGKSPCVVNGNYDAKSAAKSLLYGKLLNAGQTCIAVDYLFVQESAHKKLVAAMHDVVANMYPNLAGNPDYTSVVSPGHYDRLQGLIEDAREKGANIIQLNPADEEFPAAKRKIPPTLVMNVNPEMRIMQDEIFGPLLPIMTYTKIEEVTAYINSHPRPLAMYYLGDDSAERKALTEKTMSGGMTFNDTVLHGALDDLPFGGTGPSGMGYYHGREGFDTFSHKRGVLEMSRLTSTSLMRPPYTATTDKILNWMLKK